jgi:hypothetical protein
MGRVERRGILMSHDEWDLTDEAEEVKRIKEIGDAQRIFDSDNLRKFKFNNPNGNGNGNNRKKPVTTNKYSKLGKGDLYESVILGGVPGFLRFDKKNNKIVPLGYIEEETRTLRPPSLEEYSYIPYEFTDMAELDQYLEYAKEQTIDSLFKLALDIVKQYNDQDRHVQILIALDILWTYFQDKFPTTHYLYVSGENESGKSTVGNTFEAMGYRCVNMTNPSEANIFRVFGNVEAGQCTLVLDEFDRMHQFQSSNIMALLKTGYDHDKRIVKTNTNSWKQEWFYTYGLKIILGERSPSEEYARGVLDRTFPFTSIAGNPIADIKETLNHQGDTQRKKRYDRIIGFRKLMLVYRLMHFKDAIPDIDINVMRRNKELCKPYIQLFYGSESQREIEQTLERFLKSKNERKATSIENVLLPLIINLAAEEKGNPIPTAKLWDTILENLEGESYGPNEFHTVEYGKLYRNKIIYKIRDKFGPIPERLTGGRRAWRFDIVKLQKIAVSYSTDIKIVTTLRVSGENDSSDSSDSSDGSKNKATTLEGPKPQENVEISQGNLLIV